MDNSPTSHESNERNSRAGSLKPRNSQAGGCTLINTNKKVVYAIPYNETERYRLFQQHWMLMQVFGGQSYLAPVDDALERGIKVLDSGCGPGAWILDMATMNPESSFVGTDIQDCFPTDIKPTNCDFSVLDIANPSPFPENHFGFIHQRLLAIGLVSSDWEKVLSDHTRTLAPGGWIEYMEFTTDFIDNAGPCADIMNDVFQKWFKESDLHLHLTGQLEEMFSRAGLVKIHTKVVSCSMGQDDRLNRVVWDDVRQLVLALGPIFKKYRPDLEPEGAFDAYLAAYAKEARENKTKLEIFRIWAQKPQ